MGTVRCWWRIGEEPVDLSGDVQFQAADDLFAVLPFGLASSDVFFGGSVVTHPVGSDSP